MTTPQPRIATREDEPELIRLLHLMHAEGGMFPLDEDMARDTFALAFDRKGGIIGVIGERHDLHAMIYIMITNFWYTRECHIEELFNYVRPDARGKGYANAQINFAKECSDKIGLPLVIGVLTNSRMESKVRLYRQALGMPSGAFFVHGAKWMSERADDGDLWRSGVTRYTHTRGRNRKKKAA